MLEASDIDCDVAIGIPYVAPANWLNAAPHTPH
jgi:hypothetical protein